ncbi:carbohydrate ABC transporter membrane protein 1 (CUT1 family) [Nitrosomonas nitrosa]|uniref:Carbohydrate ABC transporter membrane protein 1, CUT1 family n=1 Tax=Nitrosomonas nitrosa TaxID=52442 RepID=A0A1I4LL10_9PROT|nr:sugar ABC transporter permease [Nitrosomonas nitrosa]PTR04928.1 carbohydrate ABC transporter membrane protein 1 (CUT1 family) [Nitrosomonas nitrosa]SFL91581.1 carbohydrate ABC transporter membrane protein 1, CUT1 family [Nitrosomonas nitrosa]
MNLRQRNERRLAWLLCAPAVTVLIGVIVYPILYAVWLSLFRYDLRFPEQRVFVGLDNYVSILTSEVWWQALGNTLILTIGSVSIELLLGFILALIMHHTLFWRRAVRAAMLIPYAMITVVAAMAWKFAFDPTTGFIDALLDREQAWLTQRGSAFLVIILTEVWKTTPFMALLLMAGLTLVPHELIQAARVDGANAWQRFIKIVVPTMKPVILVAVLFRTLDAFRIFDTVFILTRGAQNTETVSMVGYNTLLVSLNLGLGSAVSVLIFVGVLIISIVFIKGFGTPTGRRGEIDS